MIDASERKLAGRRARLTVLNTWVTVSLRRMSSASADFMTAVIRPVSSISLSASTSITSCGFSASVAVDANESVCLCFGWRSWMIVNAAGTFSIRLSTTSALVVTIRTPVANVDATGEGTTPTDFRLARVAAIVSRTRAG